MKKKKINITKYPKADGASLFNSRTLLNFVPSSFKRKSRHCYSNNATGQVSATAHSRFVYYFACTVYGEASTTCKNNNHDGEQRKTNNTTNKVKRRILISISFGWYGNTFFFFFRLLPRKVNESLQTCQRPQKKNVIDRVVSIK